MSVSSQSDTERADLARERKELSDNIEFEKEELTQIYVKRGLEPSLARQVAHQLMAKDALTAHARDELGISEMTSARPVQAALTSALTFSRRRGFAFAYGGRITHQYNCPGGVCRVFRLPRASWGNRSEGGQRGRSPRHRPSDLLGRVGDGSDHRYWRFSERLFSATRKHLDVFAQSEHRRLGTIRPNLPGRHFQIQWPTAVATCSFAFIIIFLTP